MKKVVIGHKDILEFMRECKRHISAMDEMFKTTDNRLVAKEINQFEFQLDTFLHFGCGVGMKQVSDGTFKTIKGVSQ